MSNTMGPGNAKAACTDALATSKSLESKLRALQTTLITTTDIPDTTDVDMEIPDDSEEAD